MSTGGPTSRPHGPAPTGASPSRRPSPRSTRGSTRSRKPCRTLNGSHDRSRWAADEHELPNDDEDGEGGTCHDGPVSATPRVRAWRTSSRAVSSSSAEGCGDGTFEGGLTPNSFSVMLTLLS